MNDFAVFEMHIIYTICRCVHQVFYIKINKFNFTSFLTLLFVVHMFILIYGSKKRNLSFKVIYGLSNLTKL